MLRRALPRLRPDPGFIPRTAENFTDVYKQHRATHPHDPVDPWDVRLGTAGVAVTHARGIAVLSDQLLNKGTGFTPSERDRLGLRGLLPSKLSRMEDQLQRLNLGFHKLDTPLQKYDFCKSVMDRNEVLFYRWVMENIEELAPIIYTPTVGDACLAFGDHYTAPRGMYFTSADKGEMLSMVYNWPMAEVDVIVVTDGGRVLGLGDLGANGMGIPIGKLALYVAIGGIHPGRVLPVMLDVGTNNEKLRSSPMYLGRQHERLEGREYDELVDEFMRAVKRRWPRALVQFEDFSSSQANRLLDAYRRRLCCFNDDIQGTGAVVLAALFNALRLQGKPLDALASLKVVVCGTGSAGFGVTLQIAEGMAREGATAARVSQNIVLVDEHGVVDGSRAGSVDPALRRFCEGKDPIPGGVEGAVRASGAAALIGITGCPGIFTEGAVRAMAENSPRPVVFPLSNPTSRAECSAEDCYRWTDGRAIFASGSPFDPVTLPDGRVLRPTQNNNMYIFPGVGLGAVLARAARVTDEMFYASARALALTVPQSDLEETGMLFPSISGARDISAHVAAAVVAEAVRIGVARAALPADPDADFVRRMMFSPSYGQVVSPMASQTFSRASSWGASGGAEGDPDALHGAAHDTLSSLRDPMAGAGY